MLDAGSKLDRFEQRSLHLGNKSVSIHGRSGNVAGAREVFDRMPWRSVVSWNSLMLSYAENMRGEIALEIFHRMKIEGGEPDSHSYVAAIKACGSVIDPESMARGLNLHSEAIEIGWDSNTFVATSLIDMYGRLKRLDHARRVLEAMDPGKRNVVAWNTLILRYAENGDGELALELFDRMRNEESCGPDARTFAAAAKACAAIATTGRFNSEKKKIKFIDGELVKRGMEIHELASKRGLDTDTYVGNSLVNMYVKFEKLVEAKRVFDRISHRSVVSWNSLLLGYAQSASHSGLALDLLGKMLARGTRGCQPDGRTFVAAARACACLADREGQTRVGDKLMKITSLEQGMFFHSRAATSLRDGELDIFVASSLVDMYMKCGSPQDARHVFDRMPQRSVVSWTALMAGYVENEEAELALEAFTLMQAEAAEEVVPAAFVPAAKACTVLAAREVPKKVDGRRRPVKMKSLEMGMAIHSRAGEAETDDFLASALIDMYSKCASVVDALKVFDKMVHHDVASWNALILACADNEQDELGLELLRLMQDAGDCAPNSRTFAAALKACGNSLLKCKALTAVLAETFRHTSSGPGPGSDCFLDAALVDACSKCGSTRGAQQVFDSISKPDLVIWNALIAGYSRQGDAPRVFRLFHQMQDEGIRADEATFVALLTACSHAGLVERSKKYFGEMRTRYGVNPGREHCICMVDILCRADELDDAVAMAESMPREGGVSAVAWMGVLSACSKSGNVALGRLAFDALLKMDKAGDAAYQMMASLYERR